MTPGLGKKCPKLALIVVFAFTTVMPALAAKITGKVRDSATGEYLVGAHVSFKHQNGTSVYHTIAGLDGSYSVNVKETGVYSIQTSYLGYEPLTEKFTVQDAVANYTKHLNLNPSSATLGEVEIVADIRGSDVSARNVEKLSPSVVSVISAKQIELSPDITVANVIQRVSGLSIERNASGDPQYAIVRGMDKRYNNTLVNGIKIPSPDNENRYVPLDIFPAVFLERLEVYKSLTANMEADAIGGTVNMVMRSAPSTFLLDGDFQLGYNLLNLERPFATYDRSSLNRLSPKELYGDNYRAVPADFPVENMIIREITPMPDVFANLTYGDRFYNNKLGVMLGGSFQNSYRPVSNYFYDPSVNNMPGNPQIMRQLIDRETSSQLQRYAIHAKFDYQLNKRNNVSLYVGQYNLNEFRVRDQIRQQQFVAVTNYAVYPITRFSNIFQSITTFDLRGTHELLANLKTDWSVVYSFAQNDRPDDGVFSRAGQFEVDKGEITNEIVYFQGTRNSRAWERNSDTDISAYFNMKYRPGWVNEHTELQFGGVGRYKVRDNFFNYYNYAQIFGQFRGFDWNDFGDVRFTAMANPLGSGDRSNLVYDASEQIYAAYVNTVWELSGYKIQAGLRAEQTIQAYEINPTSAAANATDLSDQQNYTNLFPALSLKKAISPKSNLKATYFKGISRPGFYEIVPTIRSNGGGDAFYSERGNRELRPSIGHSADFRYEYFLSGIDQILAGVFYKRIIDPIEFGFPQVVAGQAPITSQILPQNFDDAINFGFEADVTKYFKRIGIRANYTFTNSAITTNKIVLEADGNASLVNQTRPLQGQSDHIANLALLWKDQKRRFDVQLVFNYTGERIAFVSPFFEADHYMKPMTQLDFSLEKGTKSGWVFFTKINNILDTPYQLYVRKPLAIPTDPYPYQTDPYNIGFVRRDLFGRAVRLGVRYNISASKNNKSLNS
ncbi:MAG: outer membrane beta-barrel protein [Bacteroidia bacterium]